MRCEFHGWREPAGHRALGEALEAWVAGRPDGAASTREVDDHIVFDACDRRPPPARSPADLANVPSVRAQLTATLARGGANVDRATCVATGLIDLLPGWSCVEADGAGSERLARRDATPGGGWRPEAAGMCRGGV